MNKLVSAALFVLSCALSCASNAAPQVGWYWNPNESGRGFFIESHNGITFIGAYLYDTDGRATWLVAGGPNSDPYNFTGHLYYKTQGQTLFGNYAAPGAAVIVGNISFHFTDDTHATLTWPGGTVAVERQIFGGTGAEFQPYSGWWWNPDESGSGCSVELQGKHLFIVGFMYDDAGQPIWYYSAGLMTTDNTYSGLVLQFANGQTMTGPYKPPSTPVPVATVNIKFTRLDKATITFSGLSGTKPLDRTEEITRQFKDQFVPFFNHYVGRVTLNETADIPFIGFLGANFSLNLDVQDMDWQINQVTDLGSGSQLATYILLGGTFTLNKQFTTTVLDAQIGIVTCTVKATGTTRISYPLTSSSSLQVGNNRPHAVNISIDGDLIAPTGTPECKGPGGGILQSYTPPPVQTPLLFASNTGTAVGTTTPYVQGGFPTRTSYFGVGGSVTIAGDYDFLGTD